MIALAFLAAFVALTLTLGWSLCAVASRADRHLEGRDRR